jgi:hypothetical protein
MCFVPYIGKARFGMTMNCQFRLMKCQRTEFLTVYGSGGILSNIFNRQHQLVAFDLLFTTTTLPPTDIWTGGRLALVSGLVIFEKRKFSCRTGNRTAVVRSPPRGIIAIANELL